MLLMAEATASAGGQSQETKMFSKIISSGLTIKSQQRGEPDLSDEENIAILSEILQKQPGTFLMRFGRVLDGEDLAYFETSTDYEVTFRVKELQKQLIPANRLKKVQNRRYKCMKELAETTDYFSEEEMRQRNPLLFNYYIGQYLSEEELADLDTTTSDMALSAHIMRRMRQDERRERLERQTEREREQEEEEDEETSSSEDETMQGEATITEDEKKYLRHEFLQAMQHSFLTGEDKEFDYSKVDEDEQYDSIETQQQDKEDAYFDDEEPEWCKDPDPGSPSRALPEESSNEKD